MCDASCIHVAFLIEDDERIANLLKELVTSLGHAWVLATNLEEVRAVIARGGYCYVLMDMQIPATATGNPSVGCGETGLHLIRRAAPGRNAQDKHVLQIIVITSYSEAIDFVSKIFQMDANDFIPKPFPARLDLVLDKIRGALLRAGREDHSACLRLPPSPRRGATPAPPSIPASTESASAEPLVEIAIDGARTGRNDILVNGARGSLQDSFFLIFLNMIVAHGKTPGDWASAAKLGMARNVAAPARIRAALKDLLPEGFELIEAARGVGFRLNPQVRVTHVAWEALRGHAQAAVRKIANEQGATETGRSTG